MKKDSPFIIGIIVFPFIVLLLLFAFLYTPVDFVIYRLSVVHKEMKRIYGKRAKFIWLFTLSYRYRLHKLIIKNNLPLQFFPRSEDPNASGYFYYNKTLFLADVVPHFDPENNKWDVIQSNDELDYQVYVEAEKESFLQRASVDESIECERVVFLVEEKELYPEEKELANAVDFILPYNKKNFAKRMRDLIKNN